MGNRKMILDSNFVNGLNINGYAPCSIPLWYSKIDGIRTHTFTYQSFGHMFINMLL